MGQEQVPWNASCVVIDCETTGLNARSDDIIQIAVRTADGKIHHRMVNPGRKVPDHILQLTGLTHVDWAAQPSMADLIPWLEGLLIGQVVVGHNVGFDLQFLRRWGLSVPHAIDTLAWARLVWPEAPGYRLGDLVHSVNRLHDARHDVQATWELLGMIRDQMEKLPRQTRRDLSALLGSEWHWWHIADDLDLGNGRSPLDSPAREDSEAAAPLARIETAATGSDWLQQQVANEFDRFEVRQEQLQMLSRVETAVSDGKIFVAEAGTGTGKSLAYLVPTVLHAAKGKRVVVATHTVALQEQLWQKDLPRALQNLPLQASLLKGRGRYACLLKADQVRAETPLLTESPERRWALARFLVFLATTVTGDVDGYRPQAPEDLSLWREIVADWEACAGPRCAFSAPCFMRRARRRAEQSHIIVTNHALVAAGFGEDSVLPPYDVLILDEAHHWAEVVEKAYGSDISSQAVLAQLTEATDARTGLATRLGRWVKDSGEWPVIREMAENMRKGWADFSALLIQHSPPGETHRLSVRLTEERRTRLQGLLGSSLQNLGEWSGDAIRAIEKALELATERGLSPSDPLYLQAQKMVRDLTEQRTVLAHWWELDEETRVSWWEVANDRRGTPFIRLRIAPLNIANLLNQQLWSQVRSAVLTSATLGSDRVGQEFKFLRDRLGLPEQRVVTGRWRTPFDVQRHARLVIPSDAPDVRDPSYLETLSRFVIEVAIAREGRTLVLATSHHTVAAVTWRIRDRLTEHNILTFAQGIDGPAQRMVEEFTRQPRAVLVGTLSYWEGVDVPGSGLEAVVMTRLPFHSPGDPLEEAHAERLQRHGRSPFYEWSLPRAVVRFQQGFGRLLRTHSDHGVVVVFDGRIHSTKTRYGQRFLRGLPQIPLIVGPINELVGQIQEFFDQDISREEHGGANTNHQ